ncbi:MAG: WecB/TagA/CpsF family glycosyltransferase [Pseudomonadales bacterium]|nr:WecB/TagA/CpsF family glycosyltransferase [Pseudomonadales bacterium]
MSVLIAFAIHRCSIRLFDKSLALTLALFLMPLWILNTLLSIVHGKTPVKVRHLSDALGRQIDLHECNDGLWGRSLVLLDILFGKLSFCGVSLMHSVSTEQRRNVDLSPGLVSLYDLHQRIGLAESNHMELLLQQRQQLSLLSHIKLLVRGFLSALIYCKSSMRSPAYFSLFGIGINNVTMVDAIDWVIQSRDECQLGFFVNVNSVNLSDNDEGFKQTINQAEQVFADGSGVRLASHHFGIDLKDNVNGTDMLPLLCQSLASTGQSIFLLGSEPGIAESAATALERQHPGLKIAGHHHGFLNEELDVEVVAAINRSEADVLLLAMGSPIQERWLLKYKKQLNCNTALAVGGLFDFCSGNISRSPLWMRELGMEWVWRLLQEPGKKWRRYVLGNPRFLFKTYTSTEGVTL